MTYADLLPLFKDRLIELLDYTTLDTYRVRYHNVRTILKELKGLIEGWKKKSIKRSETIESCISEAVALIKEDSAIEYKCPISDKEQFVNILESYSKEIKDKERSRTISVSDDVIFLLSKIIAETDVSYVNNLWSQIGEILSAKGDIDDKMYIITATKLDYLTTALARELLNLGYSKQFLFNTVRKLTKDYKDITGFYQIEKKLRYVQEKQFKVIIPINMYNFEKGMAFTNFKSDIEHEDVLQDEFVRSNPHFMKIVKTSDNKKFYIYECKAMDCNSAIYKARQKLYEELDNLQLGFSALETKIQDKAIAVLCQTPKNIYYYQNTKYILDGQIEGSVLLSNKFRVDLNNIKKSQKIEKDVQVRLQSAIRHFRIGNQEQEIEQKFINYWIGLEFIFSSPLIEENTFQRLRQHLIDVLSACYVERNLKYIEEDLRRSKLLLNDDVLSIEKIDSLYSEKNITSLQRYRLKKIKSLVYTSSERKQKYVEGHREHLKMHLTRIYHFRNMLIHEAAINQDIEGITSNLRYYLYFVIEQMILFFTTVKVDKILTIDDFFYEYKLIHDYLISCKNIDDYRGIALIKNR